MTPPNWNHVDHELTRQVLEQKLIDDESIAQALDFADECLAGDKTHEDVTKEMYHARAAAIDDAAESWHLHGDMPATIEALKRFWSV